MRKIIPLIIALTGIVDIGSRFLPVVWFSKRLEEPARRYPVGIGGYTPNFHYDMSRAYGDMADLTDHFSPNLRFYRQEWMRVNKDGFREDGALAALGKPPEYVLFGDSYAAGVGLSDDATLATQFSKLSRGSEMFDAGVKMDWDRMSGVINYLGMTKGTVIVAIVARLALSPTDDFSRESAPDTSLDKLQHFVKKVWNGFWEVCPLKILCEKLIRPLQNNHDLPNPRFLKSTVKKLSNGQPMVFFNMDIENFGQKPDLDTSGLELLQERLNKRGLKLFVLLIPDKYQVYHEMLQDPPHETGPSRIDFYEKALHEADIPVLNLKKVFAAKAKEAYKKGELIFWPDDSHWNPAGARLAAQTLAQTLR